MRTLVLNLDINARLIIHLHNHCAVHKWQRERSSYIDVVNLGAARKIAVHECTKTKAIQVYIVENRTANRHESNDNV